MIMLDDLTKKKRLGEKRIEILNLDVEIMGVEIAIENYKKSIEECGKRIEALRIRRSKAEDEFGEIERAEPVKG